MPEADKETYVEQYNTMELAILKRRANKVILTFDIEGWPPREDIFDEASVACLTMTLDLLEDEGFSGIFFVTGSVAEKLREYPDIIQKLKQHRIGYHSSTHSVGPGIIALTDVPSYETARSLSTEFETSSIHPENGAFRGKGGILSLRQIFPDNHIECFRAPFFGWSPPHLEALRELGIKYDFSAHISNNPTVFKGIVFYPIPIAIDDAELMLVQRENRSAFLKSLTMLMMHRKLTILALHPSALLIQDYFDKTRRSPRGKTMIKFTSCMLKLLFKRIHILQRLNVLNVTTCLERNPEQLDCRTLNVNQVYQKSVQTPIEFFHHNPQHVLSHFYDFFKE